MLKLYCYNSQKLNGFKVFYPFHNPCLLDLVCIINANLLNKYIIGFVVGEFVVGEFVVGEFVVGEGEACNSHC